MLRLKQSEHSYFAFGCIDLLAVTENQMTLTTWCIGKIPYRKQNRSSKLWPEQPKFITLSFDSLPNYCQSLFIIKSKVK